MSFYAQVLSTFREKHLFVVLLVAASICVAALDSYLFPRYESSSTIVVPADRILRYIGSNTVDLQSAERFLDLQRLEVVSDQVLVTALDCINPGVTNSEKDAASLRSDITIRRTPFTNAIELQLIRREQAGLQYILDAIVDSYSALFDARIHEDAITLKRSLGNDASSLKEKLDEAEKALEIFDGQNQSAFMTELYLATKRNADHVKQLLSTTKQELGQLDEVEGVSTGILLPLLDADLDGVMNSDYLAHDEITYRDDSANEAGNSRPNDDFDDSISKCWEVELCDEERDIYAQIKHWMTNHGKRNEIKARIIALEQQKEELAGDMLRLIQMKVLRDRLKRDVESASWDWRIASARIRNVDRILDSRDAVLVRRVISSTSPIRLNPIWHNLGYGLVAGLCISFLFIYILALRSYWVSRMPGHAPGNVSLHK